MRITSQFGHASVTTLDTVSLFHVYLTVKPPPTHLAASETEIINVPDRRPD